MQHIVLTPEQVQLVLQARGPIEVQDERGQTIAHLKPLTEADREDIAKARRATAAGKPRIPSSEVLAHLRRLEEIHHQEGLDEARALELVRRMRGGGSV